MIETTNMTGARALTIPAERNEQLPAGQRASADYYRAYYRALVAEHAGRSEGRRGLEVIKTLRRKARREKFLREIKSLVGVLSHSTESVN